MIAYFDAFSGISGDMALGALIDLGVPEAWLQDELSGLLSGFSLDTRTVFRHHLRATDLTVTVADQDHSSRNYTDIRTLIEKSPLSETVKTNSLTAFHKIAEAESRIHGRDIETVHFHEIGGIDSIVDIVGSFLAVEYLGITKVYASAIPLGSGAIQCAHGRIPVPVPATLAILEGVPIVSSDAETEIVTPTGAAIVTTLAGAFGPMPQMCIHKTGYGSGKRETGSTLPNLLRIVLGRPVETPGTAAGSIAHQEVCVVKTNVDDMSPEVAGFLMEILLENKALDVCYIPVNMKKNRPGIQVEVLCRSLDLDNIIQIILTQTTAIGVRYHTCQRSVLKRETRMVQTRFGALQVKQVTGPDGSIWCVPEYESVRTVARARNMAFKDVYHQVACDANPLDTDRDRR